MKDLETIMDDIATIMKANIQAYVTEVNAAKGDSLLPAFAAADYHLWNLRDVPNKQISYLQLIAQDPRINSANASNLIIYYIQINTMWRIKDRDNIPKIKARYHYIFSRILAEKVAPKYPDIEITDLNSILGQEEDTEDGLVEFITVTFTVSLAI